MVSRDVKDSASLEILGQRYAQMRIVENTKIFRLGRVGSANLTRFDCELGLTESSSVDQFISCSDCQICIKRVSWSDIAYCIPRPQLVRDEDCAWSEECERPLYRYAMAFRCDKFKLWSSSTRMYRRAMTRFATRGDAADNWLMRARSQK